MSGPKQKRIFSVPRKPCKMCVRQNIRPPAGCGGKTRTVLRNELTGLPDCRGKPVIHQKHSEDEAASQGGQAVGEGLGTTAGDAFKEDRAEFDQLQCSHQRSREGQAVGEGFGTTPAGDAFKMDRAKFDQPQCSLGRKRGREEEEAARPVLTSMQMGLLAQSWRERHRRNAQLPPAPPPAFVQEDRHNFQWSSDEDGAQGAP